jgi:hypothetical protein
MESTTTFSVRFILRHNPGTQLKPKSMPGFLLTENEQKSMQTVPSIRIAGTPNGNA